MTSRDPRDPTGPGPDADDSDDPADLADFAAQLRSSLAPVSTDATRAAAIRDRAHAQLRRASAPPPARARAHWLVLAETSAALAAGASYVVWTIAQLWPR